LCSDERKRKIATYKARFTFPPGRREKGCRLCRRGDPSGQQPGVGLKKKADQYPLGSALVALPDASRLQLARAIIEIPVSAGHWKRAAY